MQEDSNSPRVFRGKNKVSEKPMVFSGSLDKEVVSRLSKSYRLRQFLSVINGIKVPVEVKKVDGSIYYFEMLIDPLLKLIVRYYKEKETVRFIFYNNFSTKELIGALHNNLGVTSEDGLLIPKDEYDTSRHEPIEGVEFSLPINSYLSIVERIFDVYFWKKSKKNRNI